MRPKIAIWSDYGSSRHKHWRSPSRRSPRSSIGPRILVAAAVVVAGVIGIYPQIIGAERRHPREQSSYRGEANERVRIRQPSAGW
jgi:hypothetical protein